MKLELSLGPTRAWNIALGLFVLAIIGMIFYFVARSSAVEIHEDIILQNTIILFALILMTSGLVFLTVGLLGHHKKD